jgi:para-aminobenzoate synthetase/4-amino-4-deoxychorismate lyase
MRLPLDCGLSPERVLLALRDEPWPFALTGRWAGGGAVVGSAPRALLAPGDDPFARLEDLPAPHGDAEVGGGWFGWLGYGLGALVEALPPRPPRPFPVPDAHLAFYDNVLRLDAEGRWWFEALDDPPDPLDPEALGAAVSQRLAHVQALLAAAPEPVVPPATTFALRPPGAAGHVAAVAECVERIAAGEIFQANLCLRLDAAYDGDVADLYAHAAPLLQPTARASSRPGAASPASRPSSSCAAAGARSRPGRSRAPRRATAIRPRSASR